MFDRMKPLLNRPFLQAPPIMLVAVGGAGLAGETLSDPGYPAAQFCAVSAQNLSPFQHTA
jgi:hypothetical protein